MKLSTKVLLTILGFTTAISLLIGFGLHLPFQLFLIYQTIDLTILISKKFKSKLILALIVLILMITSELVIYPYLVFKLVQLIRKKHYKPVIKSKEETKEQLKNEVNKIIDKKEKILMTKQNRIVRVNK